MSAVLLAAPGARISAENQPADGAKAGTRLVPSIIPWPKNVSVGSGTYEWPATMRIAAATAEEKAAADALPRVTGARGRHAFVVSLERLRADVTFDTARRADAQLGSEGYVLTVKPSGITIVANQPAGFAYALQTLAQITRIAQSGRLETQAVSIRDWPAYRWRGIHLDVSRHFFAVSTVKRYLDVAARYKLNVFHWHLTDDEGWRIEIKRRPLLAEVGACKSAGTDCAYYTQAEIRDVVAYARERNIVIVPEIDVPGHSGAAIRAYPQLACERAAGTTVLCPTDETFAFLEDVLAEVVELFPGPYVHIGGDEVLPGSWRRSPFVDRLMQRNRFTSYAQVQGYITTRLAQSLARRGRRPVAWDEALAAPIPQNVVIMAWRGRPAAALGVRLGHEVVASQDGPLYFDGYQGDPTSEPPAMRYRATLEQVYRYDPRSPSLTTAERARIIGVQANLWTEQVPTAKHMFYMLLPRELALAEIAWAPRPDAAWPDFLRRLPPQFDWLSANGYDFRIPNVSFTFSGSPIRFASLGGSVQSGVAMTSSSVVRFALEAPIAGEIRFTTDGSPPTAGSRSYRSSVTIQLAAGEAVTLRAAVFLAGARGPITLCTVRRTKTLPPEGPPRGYPSWSAMISAQGAGVYVPPRFP